MAARGGEPPPRVLAALKELGHSIVSAFIHPPEPQNRVEWLELLSSYGDVIEARSRATFVEDVMAQAREDRVEAVLALSEFVIEEAAEVAAQLGLVGPDPRVIRRIGNKIEQREALDAAEIPQPRFCAVRDPAELDAACKAVGLPAVLKPAFNAGSYLTFRVDDKKELEAQYSYAVREIVEHPVKPGPPLFLLEELLEGSLWYETDFYGDYVSVESLVHAGECIHICISDRLPVTYPFRERGIVLPTDLAEEEQQALFDLTERAVRALGFDQGVTHVEVKLTAGGPKILEVNARPGGTLPYLFNKVGSPNIMEAMVTSALGTPPTFNPSFAGVAGEELYHGPNYLARVTSIDGTKAVENLTFVTQVAVMKPVGSLIDWRKGTFDHVVWVTVVAPTHAELRATFAAARDLLKIGYAAAEAE